METRAHHVLIGAFAVLIVALGMGFALWIGKTALDREWTHYLIVFDEAVTGLTVGGAVQYNGIQVGEVRRLSLDAEDPSKVIAEVRIGSEVPVKTDTRATLSFTGLTGVALIQLSGGSPEAPLLANPDNGMPVIHADTSAIGALLASSEDIATATSKVLLRLNELLSEDNVQKVAATLAHLEQISAAAADGRDDIRTVLSKAAAASERLAELLDGAEAVMQRIDRGVADAEISLNREMPQLYERLNRTLHHLEQLSAEGEALLAENRGAISDFSQQGLGQLGPLMIDLRRLVRDLDRLSRKIERNPADVLLGRPQIPEFDPQ